MQDTERVLKIIKELSSLEVIKPEHNLQTDLALDSLMMVTLLIEVEENFDLQLQESDLNPFDLITVNDVIELVKKYKEENI